MEKIYCIDLYTDTPKKWMAPYHFARKKNHWGVYYSVQADSKTKGEILRRARKSHVRFRAYEKRWERSRSYREEFTNAFPGPYRCRYCNRKIGKKGMVVDHIIPVNRVKSSALSRILMEAAGIHDINDLRNLAPSCPACNRRKSDKTGLWTVRGFLGKYKAYWAFVYCGTAALAAAAIYSLITTVYLGVI